MLATARATAGAARPRRRDRRTEAEALPFDDESFDLVFGHAVLHHIPDLERAFGEFHRVLRPGGRSSSAASPRATAIASQRVPKRAALLRRRCGGALVGAGAPTDGSGDCSDGHELEPEVDVHAFAPARRCARSLGDAGFGEVQVRGEELVANALRLAAAHAGGDAPSPTRSRAAGAASPSAATCAAARRPRAARAAAAAGALLQPGAERAQTRVGCGSTRLAPAAAPLRPAGAGTPSAARASAHG